MSDLSSLLVEYKEKFFTLLSRPTHECVDITSVVKLLSFITKFNSSLNDLENELLDKVCSKRNCSNCFIFENNPIVCLDCENDLILCNDCMDLHSCPKEKKECKEKVEKKECKEEVEKKIKKVSVEQLLEREREKERDTNIVIFKKKFNNRTISEWLKERITKQKDRKDNMLSYKGYRIYSEKGDFFG